MTHSSERRTPSDGRPIVNAGATYCWHGIEDRSRFDLVRLVRAEHGFAAHGASVTDSYHLSWDLDLSADWSTRQLTMSVQLPDGERRLRLRRSEDDGRWDGELETCSHAGGPTNLAPDLLRALDGSRDVDIGLCPFTNTMPINRLLAGLPDARWHPITVAWIKVPSLEVVAARQQYRVERDGGQRARVAYRGNNETEYHLPVDRDGIVLDYPGLATRISPGELGGSVPGRLDR